MLVCSFQILVRWSLPRFRYDQLLRFAWKFMFPLALANLVVTAVVGVGAARLRHRAEQEALSAQAVLERARRWRGGSARTCSRSCAASRITGGVFLQQHVALDDGPQGRAHHLLPGGDARRLRAAQPRQARADAAPGRHGRSASPATCARRYARPRSSRSRRRSIPTTRRIRSIRRASRSTTRAASSAACASRRAPRTRSAW